VDIIIHDFRDAMGLAKRCAHLTRVETTPELIVVDQCRPDCIQHKVKELSPSAARCAAFRIASALGSWCEGAKRQRATVAGVQRLIE